MISRFRQWLRRLRCHHSIKPCQYTNKPNANKQAAPLISNEVLRNLKMELDKHQHLSPGKGDYARLDDENDPEGMVTVYSAAGVPKMSMPRDVWEQFQKEKT